MNHDQLLIELLHRNPSSIRKEVNFSWLMTWKTFIHFPQNTYASTCRKLLPEEVCLSVTRSSFWCCFSYAAAMIWRLREGTLINATKLEIYGSLLQAVRSWLLLLRGSMRPSRIHIFFLLKFKQAKDERLSHVTAKDCLRKYNDLFEYGKSQFVTWWKNKFSSEVCCASMKEKKNWWIWIVRYNENELWQRWFMVTNHTRLKMKAHRNEVNLCI